MAAPSVDVDIIIKSDTTKLDKLIRYSHQEFEEATRQNAEDTRSDIRSHWSPIAPSDPGETPAVRSGRLDKSVAVFKRRSGRLSSFAVAALVYWAGWLEYGTKIMKARPFMRPALKRAQQRLAKYYKLAIEKVLRS